MLHKFRDHRVCPNTKILLLGTFHPDTERTGCFFHSEAGNFLWTILPTCFGQPDLLDRPLTAKKKFMQEHGIDFADIVGSVYAPEGEDIRQYYNDEFIDRRQPRWNDTEGLIDGLLKLEAVYFTRKTFGRLPVIEKRISEIRNHCVEHCIRFCLIDGPSRFSSAEKIADWTGTIIRKEACR
jgi:G:T/U-mismatch repair DNA glycosylase